MHRDLADRLIYTTWLTRERIGEKEERQKMSAHAKIATALHKKKYRALVYFFISALIYWVAFMSHVELLLYTLGFINVVGAYLSIFWYIYYGPPSMGYTYPSSALLVGEIIAVFGLFVEIFIVAELVISHRKLSRAAKTSIHSDKKESR